MLSNKVKETLIVGIIAESKAQPATKKELIDYVRSHDDAAVRASYRLGQMDTKESAAHALKEAANAGRASHHCAMMKAVDIVEGLKVI